MNRTLYKMIHWVMLCSMILSLIAPTAYLGMHTAQAQDETEVTEEPTPADPATPDPATPEPAATEATTEAPPATEETPVTETPDESAVPVQPEAPEVTEEATASPAPEQTQEAAPEITEEAAPEGTEEVVATDPAPETTQEATAEATEETVVETVTPAPTTETPAPDLTQFSDDFEDSDTAGWTLSDGWKIAAIGDTLTLTAVTPDETATINAVDWPHLLMAARLRVTPDNIARLNIRGSQLVIALDSLGQATLYRGDTLLAQGPTPAPVEGDPVAVWRTLNLQALGSTITVGVDGVVQFVYDDTEPATSGSVTFSTDTTNTGPVSLDDITINKLDAPIATEPAPVIEETAAPEATEEIAVEATEEATAEATAEVEATEEAVVDTPDDNPLVAVEILKADFEAENANWILSEGAVIVAENETNHTLLLNGADALMPAAEVALGDFRLDARFSILTDAPTGLSIVFRAQDSTSYILSLEAAQTALFRSDENGLTLLASSATPHDLNVWHNLQLEAVGDHIVVTVNDVVEIDSVDAEALVSGSFALVANGSTSLFLDDIVVSELIPEDQLTLPTPLPAYVLTEENGSKLSSTLYDVLRLYEDGDIEGALALAAASHIDILDDALNIDVIIWPTQPQDTASLAPVIEANGGSITDIYEKNVAVRIPLTSLIPVISVDEVRAVRLPQVAVSTGTTQSTAQAPAALGLADELHSKAIIGWNDWATHSITGAGVKIAVIDNAGTHRNDMIALIKAIAPGATVTGYPSSGSVTASTMASLINSARGANNRIIVIAVDLGANVSPGDGTGGGNVDGIYSAIETARNEGRLVIASAGNNTNSYVSFNYSTVNTQVTIEAKQGPVQINVSWDDWGGVDDVKSSISGTGITAQNSSARVDEPGYRYTTTCSQTTCPITLDFNKGGNPTGYYIQVQLNTPGSITGVTGSTEDTTAGNIARPADSPNALAVGAVCSTQEKSGQIYPPMFDSSHGPIFASGGSGPKSAGSTITRDDFKPDLVGPSHVYLPSTNTQATFDCHSFQEPTGGFNGTSAASAHVAGMAALLLSNGAMSAQISTAPNPAIALQNYLQTHTVDLMAAAADGFSGDYGFDNVYGAGLSVLGNPQYDLSQVKNPLDSGGNAIYVGLANPDSAQNGTFDNPFIHPAAAIQAAVDQSKDRIVFMPGEYTSGLGIISRSNLTLESLSRQAVFWVNDSYDGQAGIQVENSTNIAFDGFTFEQADPFVTDPDAVFTTEPYIFETNPTAIQFFNPTPATSNGSVIRNATFKNFTDREPVVITRAFGVSVINSTFADIDTTNIGLNRAAIFIKDANDGSDPVLLRTNVFQNITGVVNNVSSGRETVIRIENSAVDIFSNFIRDSEADAIIGIQNSATDGSNTVNMFSNMFLNNRIVAVHLNPAPDTRFINNSVIGQRAELVAGDSDQAALLRTNGDVTMPWAVHNNLFYNNSGSAGYQVILHQGVFANCPALDNAANETGARNNWVINSQQTFSTGTCDVSFQNNNNVIDGALLPSSIFVGGDGTSGLDPATDPFYWQPLSNSTAIDLGDPTLLLPPLIDLAENTRSVDGNDSATSEPDAGAIELVPLTAGPITVEREEDIFDQANDTATAFAIDLRAGIEGGFPPYTFTLKSHPVNYSSDPSDTCLGQGVRIQGNFAFYCTPEHFYTDGVNPDVPDSVQFEYNAYDRSGDPTDPSTGESGLVTLTINAVDDLPLTTPVNYNFLIEAGASVNFRLRPSVRFENFSFSEWGTARNKEADYPFDLNTDITITDADNPLIMDNGGSTIGEMETYIETQMASPNPDGTITLQTRDGERGFVEFDYQVTDAHSSSITNTVRIEVAGILPDKGLHDDNSFLFRYDTLNSGTPHRWTPVASDTNINNTLHQTRGLNDVARFTFLGEGFVAYIQGKAGAGALWELRIDDLVGTNPPLDWVQQADGSWRATAEGYTCSTRTGVIGNLIASRGRDLYTVSCRGLRDSQAHTVEFINRNTGILAIDAFAILFDGDPVLPGFHEMDEQTMIQLFPGWTPVTGNGPSNSFALATDSDEMEDIIFSFTGSGIVIGTALERVLDSAYVPHGADYDICITPQYETAPGQEVCQNFNNSEGAAARTTWNVYRPFYGYNYNPLAGAPDKHQVRIHINDIPNNGRLVIDSIQVLDERPIGTLVNRTTEDDEIGPIVFGGGGNADDIWDLNTTNRRASNSSLTSLARRVVAAGPFISFQVPDNIDLIHWYRYAGRRDSQNILVCVDRAQGEAGSPTHCQTYNLRTAPNPLLIRESDFGGWGTAWTGASTHTVEIFSLVNESFNFDKVEIFDNDAPLPAGFYEDYVLDANNGTFGLFDATGALNGGTFQIEQIPYTRRASGSSVATTSVVNEGALFQMTGTGFKTLFTQDRFAGDVRICWLVNTLTDDVSTVEASGQCRTYVNYSARLNIMTGYTVVGLPAGSHTVTIRNLQNADRLTNKMQLDAFEVFNDTPPTNILTGDGSRYETSYEHRVEDDTFLYYGSAWRSYEGRAARRYSGENYDRILREVGAGLVFQTQAVDTIRINRIARRGYADMQVCIDGSSDCIDIPADRNPAVVHLVDLLGAAVDPGDVHTISVILTTPGLFLLDSIDVFDGSQPLPPALYEDDYPLLRYDTTWNEQVSSRYTERHAQRSSVDQAEMMFQMTGSHLEIGAFVRLYDQMEICYEQGLLLNAADVDQVCQTFPANSGQSLGARQVFQSGELANGATDYTVVIRNLNPTAYALNFLILDYIHVMDGLNPLTAGRFENPHPVLMDGRNDTTGTTIGDWQTIVNRRASAGDYLQTQVAGDYLEFDFTGTGFAIGTHTGIFGSEMMVCYVESGSFDGTWDGTGEQCLTYQNEIARASMNVTRSITGLPDSTYLVGVINLNDGFSDRVDPPTVRDIVRYPPTLVVDFVEIYDTAPALLGITDRGEYNEDAVDGSDNPYVDLLPADRWGSITGNAARNATEMSYASIVDVRSRASASYAGPAATFQVAVPANGSTTLVLDTFAMGGNTSDQLHYCILDGATITNFNPGTGLCDVLDTMPTSRYQVVTIDNTGGPQTTYMISFSTLTPGFFRIDGFQLIQNDILGAGVYEDFLAAAGTLVENGAGWTTQTNRLYTNGSIEQTQTADDYLQFNFVGTGFAIGTHTGRTGSEMLVCYQPASESFDGTWDDSANEQCIEFQNEIAATSRDVARTIAGLPQNEYRVGIVNIDDGNSDIPEPPVARDLVRYPPTLIIDYVEIFDAPAPATLGLNDGGVYNENATDGGENPYLQLVSDRVWGEITGRAARLASEESYVSVVDARGRLNRRLAGPTAVMQVTVGADDMATLTLDVYDWRANSKQLQYCVLNGDVLVECQTLDTMATNQLQVIPINNNQDPINPDPEATFTVFMQTLDPGYFRIDGFKLMQGKTLYAGHYEDLHIQPDGIIDANGTGWSTLPNRAYSNSSMIQTNTAGDFIQFEFFGTGFGIDTELGVRGSEMFICYLSTSATFDGVWDGTGEDCLNFQNENPRTSRDVTRNVMGLPQDTYTVVAYNNDDGLSQRYNPPIARPANYPPTMIIDYINIYDEEMPATINAPGMYEQDATDVGETPYIQLLPESGWGTISGRAARTATNESYVGVVDSRGRISNRVAGPTATMQVTVAANSTATISLNALQAHRANSDQIMYCVLDGANIVNLDATTGLCPILGNLWTDERMLATIDNSGGPLTTYTVVFQALTPGFFRIDYFQVVLGTVLTEGLYDDHFISDGGLIDVDGVWQFPPTAGTKVRGAFASKLIRTQDNTAQVTFEFEGTGFAIFSVEDRYRLDIEVCYVTSTQHAIDGFTSATCEVVEPQSLARVIPYGLSFYGLIPNTYMARIRVVDTPVNTRVEWFSLDAIAIFGDVTTAAPLTDGIYDDRELAANDAVRFAPDFTWGPNARAFRLGPPRGPWQLTDYNTTFAGAIMQVYVEGNALTLYQLITGRNSAEVKACLVVDGNTANELQCNTFSQSGRGAYFTPIVFYGLGEGAHQVIFENRQARRTFNVDGLRVIP